MTNPRTTPLMNAAFTTVFSFASLISFASGAVILDSVTTFTTNPDPNALVRQNTYTFDNTTDLGGFDPTGSSKLVAIFGSENANGISSITYGGVAMTLALDPSGTYGTAVYYLDNPTINGDLFIDPNGSSVNGLGGALFALSNTVSGFDATSVTSGSSTTISADAGSFVAAIGVKNQGTPPVASGPLNSTFSSGSGSSATGVGYVIPNSSGSVTPSFTNSPINTAAVEFEAIPEPSTALLFGLAGFALRRRRH